MRISLILLWLCNASVAFAGCGELPLASTHRDDGSIISVIVPEAQQLASPRWSPEDGEPPLALSQAITLGLTWARGHYTRFDEVEIDSVSLSRIGCSDLRDRWYYLVHFSLKIEGQRLFGSGNFAAVLMDGTVVPPTVRE